MTNKKSKIPTDSVKLEWFSGFMRFSKKRIIDDFPFRKFNVLSETLATMDKDSRALVYKMLCGLIITAHARHTPDKARRKELFDLKNQLMFNLLENPASRRKLMFRLAKSPRVLVIEHCERCKAKNEEDKLPIYKWKHCKKCKTQRGYYDVMTLTHKMPDASISLFLGSEHIDKVPPPKNGKFMKTTIDKAREELVYRNYHFRSDTGLYGVDLEQTIKVAKKLLGS